MCLVGEGTSLIVCCRPSFESIAAEVEAQLSELVASLRQRNTSQ